MLSFVYYNSGPFCHAAILLESTRSILSDHFFVVVMTKLVQSYYYRAWSMCHIYAAFYRVNKLYTCPP
jgi:hypothetical protein